MNPLVKQKAFDTDLNQPGFSEDVLYIAIIF